MKSRKRVLSLLLALMMLFSLLPTTALAEAPETEEPAPAEEPTEELIPAEEAEPTLPEESVPADEPEAEPAPAEEPTAGYALRGQAMSYNARGVYDSSITVNKVNLSASSANGGQTVTCTPQAHSDYRVVAVYFGPSDGAKTDVTANYNASTGEYSATMKYEACSFFVIFIAKNANMPCCGASLRVGSPGLGGSYSGTVNASLTKYYTELSNPTALDAYTVQSAVWKAEDGSNPSSFQIGKSYYVDFTLKPNTGWAFAAVSNIEIELTMPNLNVLNSSSNSGFTITRLSNGNLRVQSPLYTIPEVEDYHNLYGSVITYNEDGEYDENLVGGTVQVSTGCAQEGDTVSCTVSTNPGYTLLMVQFAIPQDEPVEDVTETLSATMRDRDMEFRAYFIKNGGAIGFPGAALRLTAPGTGAYGGAPIEPNLTKYLSFTSWAIEPSAYSVTNSAWRNEDGECVAWFNSYNQYYADFTLTPNAGWFFEDNFFVELTMPDGSVLNSRNGDFTITRNADGTIYVKSPLISLPDTASPTDGSLPVKLTLEVFDSNYQRIPDAYGGTASYLPLHPKPGDTVFVWATPAEGYQLQYVYYDDAGDRGGYDATPTMRFTVPEDYDALGISVCFTPVGTSLPLPWANSLLVELPQAGVTYSGPVSGQILNAEGRWFDVESVYWYGGTGSGCQGQAPTSFVPGKNYYPEIILTPHANWYWMSETSFLLRYHDPADSTPNSVAFDGGSTVSIDSQGRLHLVGDEITMPGAVTLRVCETVLSDTGSYLDNVDGGTVWVSVNGAPAVSSSELLAFPGDTVSLTVVPYSGYQLQQVMWGNGAKYFGVITDTLEFTISDGMTLCEIDVFYASAGAVLPIESASFELPLPVPASSYSAAVSPAIPQGFEQFEVLWTIWYSGTGSGCEGEIASSFVQGASYYAIVALKPKDNWRFTDDTTANVMLDNGVWVQNPTVTYFSDNGTLAVQTPEYPIYKKDILEVPLELELYEEGGSYTGPVPAVVTAPEGVHYTVTDANWFNYDDQESGGHGLAPTTFTRDGRYFVVLTLVPDEGYTFQKSTEISFTPGKSVHGILNDNGSLSVSSAWYSLDEENAVQYRRVFGTNYVMSASGSLEASAAGGVVYPSDTRPRVGDTITFDPVVKNGYRLQWLTVARNSEWVGDDITDTLSYTVTDEEGDVYFMACFAVDDGPVKVHSVNLDAALPAPGTYSGFVPGDVTPANGATQFTVENPEWKLYEDGTISGTESIELGKSYVLCFTLLPTENWVFNNEMNAGIKFSDGSMQHTGTGDLTVVYNPDGTLTVTSAPVTIVEQPIDAVELSLILPELGQSYASYPANPATIYTPNVGMMYTLWRNAQNQASGNANEEPTGFAADCLYNGTIRIHADQGYYLTPDTQVTLRNDIPITWEYSYMDRSIFIYIINYSIPSETYQLSGSYVKFLVNGQEATQARPGDYVTVRTDITTQPMGMYLADVSSEDVELAQLDPIRWGFTMPEKDVSVTGQLLPQEAFILDLTDGVTEAAAEDAVWLFGSYPIGTQREYDVNGDGTSDFYVEFRADGSVQAVSFQTLTGDVTLEPPSGRFGTIVYRFGPERYSLWLGGVQVTAANKNNIPVAGGTAKYDPATHTLTLTDVTGVNGLLGHGSSMPGSFFIVSSGDLTIKGSADLQSDYRGGILCGGNLTLQGDFRFESQYGFELQGDLNVIGGKLHVEAYDTVAVRVPYGSVMLTDCYAYFIGESNDALYCRDSMTVTGSAYVNFQAAERGICGGTVNFYDGYLWAWSDNDIAISVNAFNMEGGFLTATGNIQAIEAKSISIPSSHTIEKPTNGTIGNDGGYKTVIDPSTGGPAGTVWINGQYVQVTIAVKDMDGNEGVGGKTAFDDESYTATGHSKMLELNETTMICALADDGYRFDHWEGYEGFWKNEADWEFSSAHSTHLQYWAVFEELLPIEDPYFQDEVFQNYIKDNFDQDKDDHLSRAERNAVTSIDVSGLGVTSLVGIKYFPELTKLYCYNNPNLGTLDVRQNPKIKYLQCYNCSSLSNLYVIGCAELTDLRCYSCNLTGINFHGCTSLKMLQCYSNNLSYLELEECPNLARVDCFNNTNLSKLSINSDNLYILYCYKTKLDTLDVSACSLLRQTLANGTFSQTSTYDSYNWKEGATLKGDIHCNKNAEFSEDLGIALNAHNFPDADFRLVLSGDVDFNKNNWLSSAEIAQVDCLDFSGMGIQSLQGIHFLSALNRFDGDGNGITEADLSGNPILQRVNLQDNPLRSINLDGLTELRYLNLSETELTELDVSELALEELYLARTPLESLTLGNQETLYTLHAYWTDLEELDISGCPLLLDAYLNGTPTTYVNATLGNYIEYVGPQGGILYIDADQVVITTAYVPGDVNGDGVVNFKDLTRLQRYLKYHDVEVNEAALDVNGDGVVNFKDLTRLQRYLKYHDVEIH